MSARAALADGVGLGWPGDPLLLIVNGLEELARVAAAQGQAAHTAHLCAAWRAEMDAPLPLYRRATYEATVAVARHTLDEGDFAAAWAEGTAWRLEQTITAACHLSDMRSDELVAAKAASPAVVFSVIVEKKNLGYSAL